MNIIPIVLSLVHNTMLAPCVSVTSDVVSIMEKIFFHQANSKPDNKFFQQSDWLDSALADTDNALLE